LHLLHDAGEPALQHLIRDGIEPGFGGN
jgi:hypothetical protein